MKVYYACLAAYNNGRLHGAWVDASSDVDEMKEAVQAMLEASPIKDAEEWAIHDYDMEGIRLEEYTSFDDIAAIMELIEENDHDEETAKVALAEYPHDIDQAKRLVKNHIATVDDFYDYAFDCADDAMHGAPEFLQRYFDYEAFADDLQHDYTIIEGNDGMTYIFCP